MLLPRLRWTDPATVLPADGAHGRAYGVGACVRPTPPGRRAQSLAPAGVGLSAAAVVAAATRGLRR
ncbi:hypothetical protein [Streptomyces sp. NPDC001401]|uniref:hypothetical protein n=1 Tax=Streptomyces sp. NPDC001401 TaxID=3364570 RepID=UPI0036ABF0E0